MKERQFNDLEADIIRILTVSGRTNTNEIAAKLGVSNSTAGRVLHAMERKGHIRNVRRVKPRIWAMPFVGK